MFEDSLMESAGKIQTKKSRTVTVSAMVHVVLITLLILVPLIFTDQIEGAKLATLLMAPPPPPPGPPPAPTSAIPRAAVAPNNSVDPTALIPPTEIPRDVAMIVDSAPNYVGGPSVIGGSPADGTGVANGKSLLLVNTVPILAAPPPPPPAPVPPPAPTVSTTRKDPIRVGGDVQEGKLLFHPSPAYPTLARIAKVEGMVVLQATIAVDGSIKDLRVITQSSPLLLANVVDTVKTWTYRPTLLNNDPVEVVTTITINFSLGR